MINRKQLEALHRTLPEDWTPRDDVRAAVMELLSLPENDRAAGDGVLLSLSLDGVAEHASGSTLWRRGVLPPELSPLEQLKATEDKRMADMRREQEEELQRGLREDKRRMEVLQAPEKLKAFNFIDERLADWFPALGFDESQIAAARATLPNPMAVVTAPQPVEPSRVVTSLPPGAAVAWIN
jgi:hypothetical protein